MKKQELLSFFITVTLFIGLATLDVLYGNYIMIRHYQLSEISWICIALLNSYYLAKNGNVLKGFKEIYTTCRGDDLSKKSSISHFLDPFLLVILLTAGINTMRSTVEHNEYGFMGICLIICIGLSLYGWHKREKTTIETSI